MTWYAEKGEGGFICSGDNCEPFPDNMTVDGEWTFVEYDADGDRTHCYKHLQCLTREDIVKAHGGVYDGEYLKLRPHLLDGESSEAKNEPRGYCLYCHGSILWGEEHVAEPNAENGLTGRVAHQLCHSKRGGKWHEAVQPEPGIREQTHNLASAVLALSEQMEKMVDAQMQLADLVGRWVDRDTEASTFNDGLDALTSLYEEVVKSVDERETIERRWDGRNEDGILDPGAKFRLPADEVEQIERLAYLAQKEKDDMAVEDAFMSAVEVEVVDVHLRHRVPHNSPYCTRCDTMVRDPVQLKTEECPGVVTAVEKREHDYTGAADGLTCRHCGHRLKDAGPRYCPGN